LGNNPNSSIRSNASFGSLSKHSHKYTQLGPIGALATTTTSPIPVEGHTNSEQSSPGEELSLEIGDRSNANRRNTIQLVPSPEAASPLPFSDAAASTRSANKMHQTSSRLLRMTEDERPFTKVCEPSQRMVIFEPDGGVDCC
jgi:hypothetical protein